MFMLVTTKSCPDEQCYWQRLGFLVIRFYRINIAVSKVSHFFLEHQVRFNNVVRKVIGLLVENPVRFNIALFKIIGFLLPILI